MHKLAKKTNQIRDIQFCNDPIDELPKKPKIRVDICKHRRSSVPKLRLAVNEQLITWIFTHFIHYYLVIDNMDIIHVIIMHVIMFYTIFARII